MTAPKIVQLTTVHVWNDTRIWRKQCASLAAAGYDVTLIAPGAPLGRQPNGVRTVPLPLVRGRMQRMTLGLWRGFWAALREPADLYHFHDPELMLVGTLLKLCGKKVIYDVHEDYSCQSDSKHWIPGWARAGATWLVGLLESLTSRIWDGIVSATPAIARKFSGPRAISVQNFPLQEELTLASRTTPASTTGIMAYVGYISEPRGIRQVLDTLALLARERPARLALVGRFSPAALEDEARAHPAWPLVDFHGWCSPAQIADLLAPAQVGLVTFLPEPNHMEAQPNKLFDYMAAGLPIVASDFPHWRSIIESTGAGLLVDPTDPVAIALAVQWLLDHPAEAAAMGRRGQQAVRERFNWNAELQGLLALYAQILGRHPEPIAGQIPERAAAA